LPPPIASEEIHRAKLDPPVIECEMGARRGMQLPPLTQITAATCYPGP